jgi:hypothetical protein
MLHVDAAIATYLQRFTPHRSWHYLLAVIALIVASVPVWLPFDLWTGRIIWAMAAIILSLYWLLQFRIMQSAVSLSRRVDVPDRFVGAASPRALILAKVRGVIKHHSLFILLISLALMGLSLMITIYLYHGTSWDERGILRYVGVVSSGWVFVEVKFPFLQWPAYYILAGVMLVIFTLINSLLSISIGLLTRHWGKSSRLRLLIFAATFGLFLVLYALRETPAWTCHRSRMLPNNCSKVLFQLRLVDSLQALLLSFSDGGASLVTGIHLPMGVSPKWEGYQWRHLLVGIVTYACQLTMSGCFLWLTSHTDTVARR